MQCEEQRDLHGIQWFFGKVIANIYFIWIICTSLVPLTFPSTACRSNSKIAALLGSHSFAKCCPFLPLSVLRKVCAWRTYKWRHSECHGSCRACLVCTVEGKMPL